MGKTSAFKIKPRPAAPKIAGLAVMTPVEMKAAVFDRQRAIEAVANEEVEPLKKEINRIVATKIEPIQRQIDELYVEIKKRDKDPN